MDRSPARAAGGPGLLRFLLILLLLAGLGQLPGVAAQTDSPTLAPSVQWLPEGTYPTVPFWDAYISSTNAPDFPYEQESNRIQLREYVCACDQAQ